MLNFESMNDNSKYYPYELYDQPICRYLQKRANFNPLFKNKRGKKKIEYAELRNGLDIIRCFARYKNSELSP